MATSSRNEPISSCSRPLILVVFYFVIASCLYIHGNAIITLPKGVVLPAIFLFGDSVVDTGNNNYLNTIGKANYPPYGRDFDGGVPTGRYSNGKVPPDLLAEELGIKEFVPPYLDPTLKLDDLLTGVTFASGSAGYDPASPKLANAISIQDQLKMFEKYIDKIKTAVGEERTSTIISQSVYVLCTGTNDITQTFLLSPIKQTNYSTYTDKMVNWGSEFIQNLYNLGARRIGVLNIPPCGCLPSQRTVGGGLFRQCVDVENQAAMLFNKKFKYELSSLNQKLPDSRVVYLDIYNPLMNLIANPSQYGFEVADRGCCGTGKIEVIILCNKFDITCEDASKYIFWDSFHPTEATYRILVQEILQKSVQEFY